jgi:hypothetical protein
MDTPIRLRLETGDAALAFSLANPSPDPNHAAIVTRLGGAISRGRLLTEQALTGQLTEHASVETKDELTDLIRERMQVISSVADLANREQPGVAEKVRVPAGNVGHKKLFVAAHVALSQATLLADLLYQHGMPQNFLAEFSALIDQFQQAIEAKKSGNLAHVGANAELEQVTREILRLVKVLDRLNRVRFRKDPQMLAAWNSARTLAVSSVKKPEPPKAPEASA